MAQGFVRGYRKSLEPLSAASCTRADTPPLPNLCEVSILPAPECPEQTR